MADHSLIERLRLNGTDLECSCGEWSATSPLRLMEWDNDDARKRLTRKWYKHRTKTLRKERQMDLEDFCAKVEYEGGVIEALRYGLKSEDIRASESPRAEELSEIWVALDSAWHVIERLEAEAEKIVSEVLDARDDSE